MPAYSSDTKKYHRERVRSILVQNPMLAGEHIRRKLSQDGLVLDRNYINAIVNQIHRERVKRAETWTLNSALTALQDAMGEVVRVGWEIANDKMAEGRDRAAALREIREAYNLMFEKMFDAGVFERKLGTFDAVIRNTPLPEERKQAIRSVFENWGLLETPKEDVPPKTDDELLTMAQEFIAERDAEPSTTTPAS
jgi:hypothetical protein